MLKEALWHCMKCRWCCKKHPIVLQEVQFALFSFEDCAPDLDVEGALRLRVKRNCLILVLPPKAV